MRMFHHILGPSRRQIVASRHVLVRWLMVVVLLLETLAPLATSGAAAANTLSAALDGDHIVVCTAAGIMVLERDGTPVRRAADSPSGLCLFCLPLLQGGADVSPGIALALMVPPSHAPAYRLPIAGRVVAHEPLAGAAASQAPPSV